MGLEPTTGKPAPDFESVGNREIAEENGSFSFGAAVGAAAEPEKAVIDPDLAVVVAGWPTLPEPVKAGILAMVRESVARAGG